VRTPDGGRRYLKTATAAADLVERYYRDDGGGNGTPEDEDETDPAPDSKPKARRVAVAELRATSGDIATLAVDVNRLDAIDQSKSYRIVTVPADAGTDREFASLLRSANETMHSVRIAPDADLVGVPVGALRPSVVAIRPGKGRLETLPPDDRRCAAGDTLYAVGRHDELCKLAAAARDGRD